MKEKRSEFPDTLASKLFRKLGWLFSPLLIIFLLSLTFFLARDLKLNTKEGKIERQGSFHMKELKDASIYLDGQRVGKSGDVLYTSKTDVTDDPVDIRIEKSGRTTWQKQIKPKEGYVNILYPLMFPDNFNFGDETIQAYDVYPANIYGEFFYSKIEDGKFLIYKYKVSRTVLIMNYQNEVFADISDLVKIDRNANLTPGSLKNFKIIPSYEAEKILLIIPDEGAFIVNNKQDISKIDSITPDLADIYFWTPNDSYILVKSGNEILSYELSSKRLSIIYRKSPDTQADIQFITDSGVVYKVTGRNYVDLVQNSFSGNQQSVIDIPNIDDIRNSNLQKAFDLLKKGNSIIIQSSANIYLFNTSTFEIKKINKFEAEEVISTDPDKQIMITVNKKVPNQFRYYNLEQNESRTFILKESDPSSRPECLILFNYAQSLFSCYDNKFEITDADGSNSHIFTLGRDPKALLTGKFDNIVFLAVGVKTDENDSNPYSILIGKFEN